MREVRIRRLAPVALAVLALAAAGKAQTLSVPEGALTAGSSVAVTYADPDAAGQTVHVTIDNGEARSTEVTIELDNEGRGSASWFIPKDWGMFAVFSAPDAESVTRWVN